MSSPGEKNSSASSPSSGAGSEKLSLPASYFQKATRLKEHFQQEYEEVDAVMNILHDQLLEIVKNHTAAQSQPWYKSLWSKIADPDRAPKQLAVHYHTAQNYVGLLVTRATFIAKDAGLDKHYLKQLVDKAFDSKVERHALSDTRSKVPGKVSKEFSLFSTGGKEDTTDLNAADHETEPPVPLEEAEKQLAESQQQFERLRSQTDLSVMPIAEGSTEGSVSSTILKGTERKEAAPAAVESISQSPAADSVKNSLECRATATSTGRTGFTGRERHELFLLLNENNDLLRIVTAILKNSSHFQDDAPEELLGEDATVNSAGKARPEST